MGFSGSKGLVLSDNRGKMNALLLKNKDNMDMVWHYHVLINLNSRKMQRDVFNTLLGQLPQRI